MKRILSIDFDYFIDTDIHTRNTKFPDGVEKSKHLNLSSWYYAHQKFPNLIHIGVIEEFHNVYMFLSKLKKGKVLIADSHRDIIKLFNHIPLYENLEVVHIDFHHDCYISSGAKLDCANWVRHLKSEKPDTHIVWYRREDSELESLEGEYPYPHTTDLVLEGEFDYIFLCFSPEWTPPHLDFYFESMCYSLRHLDKLD